MKQAFQQKRGYVLVVILTLLFVLSGNLEIQASGLSEQSEISIITCAPGNESYAVYGHSAIRVKDDKYNYDSVFNYGIFDFDAPNFVYRFASGQTDYLLGVYKMDSFLKQYKIEHRSVYEQVLNLTMAEKQKIFDFLRWNARPENRVYRYNFFFDNCATRIRDVVNENIEGGVKFNEETQSHKTLRQLVEDCHGKLLWLTFGIDLVVSSESDREATFWEEMFLPDYLMNHFAEATKKEDGLPLVKKMNTIYEAPVQKHNSYYFAGPFVVLAILVLWLGIVSYKQFRRGKMKIGLDFVVYGFNGFIGIVLSWMAIFSEHPAMSPNYNILWAVPLNFLFMFLWMKRKWRPRLMHYHVFMSVWLVLFFIVSAFIPQKFNPAFYLLALMVLIRSASYTAQIFKKQKFIG